MTATDTHYELWQSESAACEPTNWERWIDAVQRVFGNADGDQATDGFSLDWFYDQWEAGLTPAEAIQAVNR